MERTNLFGWMIQEGHLILIISTLLVVLLFLAASIFFIVVKKRIKVDLQDSIREIKGKIVDVEKITGPNEYVPVITTISLEDGSGIVLAGHHPKIKKGKTYRLRYQGAGDIKTLLNIERY